MVFQCCARSSLKKALVLMKQALSPFLQAQGLMPVVIGGGRKCICHTCVLQLRLSVEHTSAYLDVSHTVSAVIVAQKKGGPHAPDLCHYCFIASEVTKIHSAAAPCVEFTRAMDKERGGPHSKFSFSSRCRSLCSSDCLMARRRRQVLSNVCSTMRGCMSLTTRITWFIITYVNS